jgi:hypothetical protein
MLKNLIRKIVGEEIAAQTGKPDLSTKVSELEKENAELKAKLENSGAAKRLSKVKEMAAAIPAGAQGMGMIAVIEDGVAKNVELKSKADLEAVIARAEKGEVEILLS